MVKKNNYSFVLLFGLILLLNLYGCSDSVENRQYDANYYGDAVIADIKDVIQDLGTSDTSDGILYETGWDINDTTEIAEDKYAEDTLTEDDAELADDLSEEIADMSQFDDLNQMDIEYDDLLSDLTPSKMISVYPEEDKDSLFANPGMGWQTFYRSADSDQNLAGLPTTTIYRRFTWQELEPEEGKFNFSVFDDWLSRAKKNGQRLAIRLMVSASGPASQNTPLLGYAPLWLIDKGASGWIYYRDNNGNKKQDSDELDVWSPDLADPIARNYHDRLVNELSKKYNGHPYLDLIDIGSVGLWGEWHFYAAKIKEFVGNPPTGGSINSDIPMYSESLRKEIIDLWREKFDRHPKTMLIGDLAGLTYAAGKNDLGWRADCWGDMSWHMPNFYDNQLNKAKATDLWINGPVALETCWDMKYWFDKGWDIDYILKWAEDHHATYIQNKSKAIPEEWLDKVKDSLKRIGYRFVLKSLEHPEEIKAGETLRLSMLWENKGVAPLYWDYFIQIRLERIVSSLNITWTSKPLVSMKGILPGEKIINTEVTIPLEMPEGEYDLMLSVRSDNQEYEHPNLRYIKIAIKNPPDTDGWYKISRVRILKR